MKRYYIKDNNSEQKLIEVTEEEYISFCGTEAIRKYCLDIYYNKISISDVPAELQEQVQTTVNNRIARFGEYGIEV